jgi:transcriptional regulator with XRE-family HTH domain
MVKEVPFSEWLNEKIQKSGMSQARFARLAGLNETTISKLLNGKTRRPDPETCLKMARILKVHWRTVYRAAGLWPFEPEYPQQDDLNYLVAQLPDWRRQEILEHVRLMLEFEQKNPTGER